MMKKIIRSLILTLGIILFYHSVNAQAVHGYSISLYSDFNAPSNSYMATFTSFGYPIMPPAPDYSIVYGATVNFTNYPNLNDKAKSAKISGTANTKIFFFKDEGGDFSKPFCEVLIKQNVGGYILTRFEHNYEDAWIKVNYYHSSDLDGEISCIGAYYTGPWIPPVG